MAGQSHVDSFTYDAAGRMLTAVSGRYNNTVTCTYDSARRKSSESLTLGGQTYTTTTTYDAASRVSGYVYPDGTSVTRGYTDRGQLATIAIDGTTVDTRVYDDGARLVSSTYNNGVSQTRTYNTDNTLAGIDHSGALSDYTYTWDANKNKTGEAITGALSSYGFNQTGYDDEDRLTNWNRTDGNLDQAWDLSLVGDWNSYTENGSVQNRSHGPTHELLTVAGGVVTHDAKGNQTALPISLGRTNPLSMKWDFENKLIAADTDNDGSDDVSYTWDALLRRVGRDDGANATIYVQNGQQTIADYVQGSVPASPEATYTFASYIDEPVTRDTSSGRSYYHRNQQYSIFGLTNATGTVTEQYAYDAYGEVTVFDGSGALLASSDNRYFYTGREWDGALGLYHYRARMYDSEAGRFCSRDPIGFEGSPWNLHQYVWGNPGIYVDPSGNELESCTLRGSVGECEDCCFERYRGPGTSISLLVCIDSCGGRRPSSPPPAPPRGEIVPSLPPPMQDPYMAAIGDAFRETFGMGRGQDILWPDGSRTPIKQGMAPPSGGPVGKKLSKVLKSKKTQSIGRFTKTTEVRPGRGPGQSRAEYVRIKNSEGKVIRTYKDTFDRSNCFQHRKPLRGGPEGRPPGDSIK